MLSYLFIANPGMLQADSLPVSDCEADRSEGGRAGGGRSRLGRCFYHETACGLRDKGV